MLNETIGTAAAAIDIATAVSADGVTRRYGEGESAVHALRGVTLKVPVGQFTAVMGPSGSGKSTLMHLLAGLDRPTAGRVTIGGQDITEMADKQLTKLRRRHIGFVFQSFNLLPMLTAEENILLPLSIAGRKPDAAWLESLIETVGLGDRRKHRPAELSGGQQQRVAVVEVGDLDAVELDRARGRAVEPGEQVHERGLARARGTHDGRELADGHLERDAA